MDLFYLSEKFDPQVGRTDAVLDEYAAVAETVIAKGDCRSDILRAAIGILLANLDRINPDRDYDRWVVAAKRAERVLEYSISCSPYVSDYWLRLAMVKRAAGEEPNEQARLLSRAVNLDPSSVSGLRARFAHWRKLGSTTLRVARPSLEKDMFTLLQYARPEVVRDVLRGSSIDLKPYIQDGYQQLPVERQQRLARWRALPDFP